MDYFHTQMELKTVDVSRRVISGYAAIHHSVDRVRDVIDPQASVKAVARLQDPSKGVGVFIGHDTSKLSIGYPQRIEATPKGLYTETYVWKGPDGDNLLAVAKDMLDHGHALGQSIGYRTVDSRHERNGNKQVRRLMDYDLKEYSYAAPQVIAHPDALVTDVKSKRRGQKALSEGSETAGGALVSADRKGTGMQYRVEQQGGKWAVLCDADADGDEDDGRVVGSYDSQDMATAVALALRKEGAGEDDDDGDADAGKTAPTAPERKAEWSAKDMDTFPDSSFLFVEDGGVKDSENKTTPRSKRHFPVKDAEGKVDLAHVRNAIARIPQSDAPGLDDAKKAQLQARARRMLGDAEDGKTYEEPDEWKTGAPIALLHFSQQLADLAADAVTEHKAMAVLGEDTKGHMRLRPELRARISAVQTDLTKFMDWADAITRGEDGLRRVALLKQQLALTEV